LCPAAHDERAGASERKPLLADNAAIERMTDRLMEECSPNGDISIATRDSARELVLDLVRAAYSGRQYR
jgi:hypothetical protein